MSGRNDTGAVWIEWDGGQWYFDCTLNEIHESRLVVTEHPVEQGPNISENARRELDRFSCEVFVSNSPIFDRNKFGGRMQQIPIELKTFKAPFAPTPGAVFNAIGGAVTSVINTLTGAKDPTYAAHVLAWDTPFDAVAATHFLLGWLQDFQILTTVHTSVDTYENMLLEVQQLKREREDGDGGRYRLSFKQLRTVSLAFTDAPTPTNPRGTPTKNKGTKGTKKASPKLVSGALAHAQDAGVLH